MFNYIKMEVYRMFRSKSTWTVLLILMAFCFFSVYMLKVESDEIKQEVSQNKDSKDSFMDGLEAGWNEEQDAEEDEDVITFGIGVVTDENYLGKKVELTTIFNSIVGGRLILLFAAIFTTLFVYAEEKRGFIKNIAGQTKSRVFLVVGNAVAIMLWHAIVFLAFIPLAFFSAYIYGDALTWGPAGTMLSYLAVQYLLHVAFSLFLMFLCMLTRSSAASMVFGVLQSMGMLVIFYSLFNRLVRKIDADSTFEFGKCMVEQYVGSVVPGAGADIMLPAVLVGVFFAVASLSLSALLMAKRDVR